MLKKYIMCDKINLDCEVNALENTDFTVTDVVLAYYKKCSKNFALNVKNREYNGLTLIISGEMQMSIGCETHILRRGDILMQRKGDEYHLAVLDECEVEYIVISYLTDKDEKLCDILPKDRIFVADRFNSYLDAFNRATKIYASSGICYMTLLRATVQEIICNIIRDTHSKPLSTENNPAASAKYYIDEYFDRKITAEDISSAANCSASHLRKLFREAYGCSPGYYLNFVRIERAKELLSLNMLKIDDIAVACGFQNVHYFSNVFKKMTGTSPSKY